MMKRIVAVLFFLSLLLGAVALVAPGFIDWSKHKDTILSQLEPYIARKLQVDGKVSFRIIPSPEIVLENVTLANAEGAKAPHFMKLKQLEARMKLQPLLQGRFEIETINLASPEVNLETLPEGGNNWSGIFRTQEGVARPDAVQLNNMSMTDGTIRYQNPATGAEWVVEDLDLAVTADTLHGPFKARGGMHYGGAKVGIEGGTGKYEPGTPLPVNVTLTPADTLPKVTFSGVADLSSGVDLQGELGLSQGAIASLLDNDFLRGIDFLSDSSDVTAMLNTKGGEVSLTDIKGKTGKKGEFSGKVTAVFAPGKKPEVVADMEGHDLKITGKSGFLHIPASFVPHVKAKLKSVTWGGVWLPGIAVSIDANDKEWVVKDARIDLPGKSVLKLAGVVTPKTKYGAFSIQVTSQDVPKMAKSGLADSNILKPLAASGIIRKLDVAASLDVRADKISLFDLDAKLNDDAKVTGVLNITRGKPVFEAKLNFDKGDIAAVMSDAYAGFMGSVLKADASLEITVKNFTKGDLAGADLAFRGKTEGGALHIDSMTGTLGTGGSFAVNGKAAGVNPVSGMELEYSLKASPLGGLSAYGVEIPPPLWGSNAVDVKGKVAGDAQKYSFTVEGTAQNADVSLDGTATAGNQGTYSYQTNVKLKNATWSQIGLPVDNLLADGKPFNFTAKLSGTRANYQLDSINAGGVTGSLSRRDGRYSGELDAAEVTFDKWLWENWKVSDPLELKLKAEKLSWRSNDIANAQLSLEASADAIKVSDAKGEIWGGNVSADIDSARQNGKWKGKMTGKILGADLQKLSDLLEFKGIELGQGDLSIDVTDDDSKTEKDWFVGMDGTLGLTADSVTVQDFSPSALGKMVAALNGAPTDDFTAEALRTLRSEDTTYNNVEAAFTVGGGKVTIDKLKLSDDAATVDVTGNFVLGPETFTVAAAVKLKRPDGVPSFTVTRSGEMENAPTYTAGLRPLENWLAKAAASAPAPLDIPQDNVRPHDLDAPPVHETVILPQDNAQPEPPVQIYPPVDRPLPHDIDEPSQADPPPAVVPGEENADIINSEPIDTEQLASPQDSNMNLPTPPQPPTPPQGDMKGVFDRLNSLPGEPEPPAAEFTLQKPEIPKPEDEEILPRD